jgi:hypothetical protein
MRLVLHPKVFSDIDEVMGYYERIATRELANEFYSELRHYMQQAAERPESFAIRERDLRRVNLQRFRIIFCFVSLAMSCGFWSYAITDVPPSEPGADNVATNRILDRNCLRRAVGPCGPGSLPLALIIRSRRFSE